MRTLGLALASISFVNDPTAMKDQKTVRVHLIDRALEGRFNSARCLELEIVKRTLGARQGNYRTISARHCFRWHNFTPMAQAPANPWKAKRAAVPKLHTLVGRRRIALHHAAAHGIRVRG